jgi:hypothetical protein
MEATSMPEKPFMFVTETEWQTRVYNAAANRNVVLYGCT